MISQLGKYNNYFLNIVFSMFNQLVYIAQITINRTGSKSVSSSKRDLEQARYTFSRDFKNQKIFIFLLKELIRRCFNQLLLTIIQKVFMQHRSNILRLSSAQYYDKYSNSDISISTRGGSPESVSLSPFVTQKVNDNWKRDIMPVCRSANFSTQEGRKYLQCKVLSEREVEAYFEPIVRKTLLSEAQFPPLKLQEGVDRSKAVLDMLKIQTRGALSAETLHLAVRMADIYLLDQPLTGNELAALGCVCMWLAAKMQDISAPKFRFWVGCGERFLEEELTSMEIKVLQHFRFDLDIPTTLDFFNLLLPHLRLQERTHCLCLYLMELALLDSRMLEYPPSVIALSSLYIAMQISDPLKWNDQRYCGLLKVNSKELKECSTLLVNTMVEGSKADNEVTQKYGTPERYKVSKITFRKTLR